MIQNVTDMHACVRGPGMEHCSDYVVTVQIHHLHDLGLLFYMILIKYNKE